MSAEQQRDETRATLLRFVALLSRHIADVRRMRGSAIADARHFGATPDEIATALDEEPRDER
jgi:hypothetical protein